MRPRVLRTGNYSTPVLSEICLPVEHLPAGIRWPAARLCRNVCTASSYFCRSRPPLPLTVLGTCQPANSMWGEKGSVLDGCASPLPGSPGGCGVVEPSGRPPSLSGRGLCGVCPTSALLYFCISPAMPLLPLRILSSQMPPTATLSPGIHLRRYHGESLSKKGTYLIKSDKKVKMSIQGTKKNKH